MDNPLKLEFPLHTLRHTTVNVVIHTGPAKVCSVCLAAAGAAGNCDIYDGDNANMELKIHLEALNGTTFNFEPSCGVKFNHGIFATVNAATTHCMVVYTPIEPKAKE